MKALTLIRPWAWALFNGKPIENRSWTLPDRYLGEPIAIHAGRKWDRDGAEFVYRMLGPASTLPAARAEGVVGVVTFDRVVFSGCMDETQDAICASPWFFGPYGFVARDQRELAKPVPCRGAQGLWTLPEEIEAEVRRQLEVPSLDRCLTCSEGVLDYRLGGMCADCEVDHA